MIRRLIINLRSRSKESRDNIALGIAVTFTGLVLVVWLYHLPAKIVAIQEKHNQNGEEDPPGLSSIFSSLSEEISEIKKSNSTGEAEVEEDVPEEEALSSTTLSERQKRYASSSASGDFFLNQDSSENASETEDYGDGAEMPPTGLGGGSASSSSSR